METPTFIMPDFNAPVGTSPQSEPSVTVEKKNPIENLKQFKEKKKLSKVNRVINCIHCEVERTLNPDQYQAYYDYWGDEDKIKRNFVCQPCDTKIQDNPFSFWLQNHETVARLVRQLKAIFELYKNSGRSQEDVIALQNMTTNLLRDHRIDATNLEFILDNRLPVAIKVAHMPFVGPFELRPYDEVKVKITQ